MARIVSDCLAGLPDHGRLLLVEGGGRHVGGGPRHVGGQAQGRHPAEGGHSLDVGRQDWICHTEDQRADQVPGTLQRPRHQALELDTQGPQGNISKQPRSRKLLCELGEVCVMCMQDMLRAAVWEFEVPQAMKELPMSLMGHCALMVNNNLGTVKGLYKGYN